MDREGRYGKAAATRADNPRRDDRHFAPRSEYRRWRSPPGRHRWLPPSVEPEREHREIRRRRPRAWEGSPQGRPPPVGGPPISTHGPSRKSAESSESFARSDRLGMSMLTSGAARSSAKQGGPSSKTDAFRRKAAVELGPSPSRAAESSSSSAPGAFSPGSTQLQELHAAVLWEAAEPSWQNICPEKNPEGSDEVGDGLFLTPPRVAEFLEDDSWLRNEARTISQRRSRSPLLSPEESPREKRRRLFVGTPPVSDRVRRGAASPQEADEDVEEGEEHEVVEELVAAARNVDQQGQAAAAQLAPLSDAATAGDSTLVLEEASSLLSLATPAMSTPPSLLGDAASSSHGLVPFCPLLDGCRKVHTYYRKLNKISEGTYGAVYRAQEKATGKFVALKHIKYHERVWEEGFPLTSLREISILLDLKHPHIVNVLEVVIGANPNHVYMVMEYVEHELKLLLEDNRPPFSVAERKTLLRQLLEAVSFIHSRWVIHRDLKTSNLLYSNKGELKVCDFGMARRFGDPIKPYTHNVVTLWYRAPELLLGQKEYTEAVDLWSVGCIFGELILRKPLFNGKTEANTLDKIFKLCGTPDDDVWPGFSSLPFVAARKIEFARHGPSWREIFPVPKTHITESSALSDAGLDLLSTLLSLDPRKRLSAQEALNHPFFTEKPLPQRTHLMPSAPDSNVRARGLRHPESLNEEDRANRSLFRDADFRFSLGKRVDPARYLVEMETAAAKLKKISRS